MDEFNITTLPKLCIFKPGRLCYEMDEFNITTLPYEQTHFWRWLNGGGWSMSTSRIDILKAYDGEFGHKYPQNRTDVLNFYSTTLTIYGERLKSKSV